MSRQIQQGVHIGHTHSAWSIGSFHNRVVCTNFSLLQHAKVESRPVMFYQQRGHPRLIHADADPVTRHARLRHFKFSITDPKAIADADLVIRKSLHGEVFPELTEYEIVAA